ncbi:MAG TPA: hypothetical protein VLQ68_11985, partial [Rhizobiaceae bacterium]|nr:hypothetical protein [Rhizobiaceae bacterium]
MTGFTAIAFAVACGFTAAGLVTALYQMTHTAHAGFRALFGSPAQALWSLALCTFAGPWIMLSAALHVWRTKNLPVAWVGAAAALSAVW